MDVTHVLKDTVLLFFHLWDYVSHCVISVLRAIRATLDPDPECKLGGGALLSIFFNPVGVEFTSGLNDFYEGGLVDLQLIIFCA